MNVNTLEDLLFSPGNIPLLKRIKEEGRLEDAELKQKIHQLSKKRIEKLVETIQSINLLQPDPKIQGKICGQLLGVRFSPEFPESEQEMITFQTAGITKNLFLLTSALVNEFVLANNLSVKRNKKIDQENIYTGKLNNLIDLLNQFLPIETNDIDAILSHGHYILENQLSLSYGHPFQRITALANKRILERIEKERNRSLILIEMEHAPRHPEITLNQQKIILLSTIISEELHRCEAEILGDIRVIEEAFPAILETLRSSFREEEVAVIQSFFNRFLSEVLPDLTDPDHYNS